MALSLRTTSSTGRLHSTRGGIADISIGSVRGSLGSVRFWLSLIAITLATIAVGCGGGDEPPADSIPTADASVDELQVIVADFIDAVAAGEGEKACGALTDELQQRFNRFGETGCLGVIGSLARAFESEGDAGDALPALARTVRGGGEATQWEISPGRAELTLTHNRLSLPVRLVELEGDWLIAGGRGLGFVVGTFYPGSGPPGPPSSIDIPTKFDAGQQVVEQTGCLACHQFGTAGGDLGPDLTNIGSRLTEVEIVVALESGPGVMPSYRNLEEEQPGDFANLVAYLASLK